MSIDKDPFIDQLLTDVYDAIDRVPRDEEAAVLQTLSDYWLDSDDEGDPLITLVDASGNEYELSIVKKEC